MSTTDPPKSNSNWFSKHLLWVDCVGGLVVGLGMFAVFDWLKRLYGMPTWLYLTVALANVCYGLFSLTLALKSRRPRFLLHTLVFANIFWGVVCVVLAATFSAELGILGLIQLVGEGLYVAGLGCVEWRFREQLLNKK
jgi:hypothetical protein